MDHFSSAKEAYHQLMFDLVSIQAESIKLAEGSKNVDKLIVTGGFSQNDLYVSLLASFFPEKEIYTSKLSNASALGAAMVINEKIVNASLSSEPLAQADGAKQSHSSSHESQLEIVSQDRNDSKELLGLKLVEPLKDLHFKNYFWV